jgi:probable F420-dependent oxidoreductase
MPSHGILLPTRASVQSSPDRATLTARTAADVVGLAQRIEALGFDSVWVGDSVLAKPRHEPLTTLAAVGAATEAVELGTAVYLPPLRDPVHIAHQAATVDQLSGGRLRFGVGTGSTGETAGSSVEDEFRELGVPWERRGDVLDEQLDVMSRLWSGESVEYDGEFYDLDGASIGFQPARDPPIQVGCTINPEKGIVRSIRERIAAHADGWLPVVAPPDAIELGLEQLETTMEHADRDISELTTVYYQDVLVADSEADAIAIEREFIEEYYPGWTPTDEELKRRGAFGPPEQIREHLRAYEQAGVDHFVTRFPAKNQREQLSRFAALLDDA